MKSLKLIVILALCYFLIYAGYAQEDIVKVTPLQYEGALNNPLKGFRYSVNEIGLYPYDAITRAYINSIIIKRKHDKKVNLSNGVLIYTLNWYF